MIVSPDPNYIDTRLVKQGAKRIAPACQLLVNWISEQTGIKVLNIYYDTIEADNNRPRLSVIFEFYEEEIKFKNSIGNSDMETQKLVADKFKEILIKHSRTKQSLFSKIFIHLKPARVTTKNLFVIFDSFEPVAQAETNQTIPESEIEKLLVETERRDLWKIQRQFPLTTFFFYTNKQIEKYLANGTAESLKQRYFTLLKKYDEFDYIKTNAFLVKFDSKENFDNNYHAGWFYYSANEKICI